MAKCDPKPPFGKSNQGTISYMQPVYLKTHRIVFKQLELLH